MMDIKLYRIYSKASLILMLSYARGRLRDNKQIMTNKNPSPWQDTFVEEEMNKAKLSGQIAMHGNG